VADNKQLKIWFEHEVLEINLYSNPVSEWLYSRYKHLAHLPLDFGKKNLFFDQCPDRSVAEHAVKQSADRLGITIQDLSLSDQSYLNYLHSVYEKNFLQSAYKEKTSSTEDWVAFHDAVHMMEKVNTQEGQLPFVSFDHNVRAGALEKTFDRKYLKYATSQVKKNQCFVQWEELGKTPWDYFQNCEPNDIDRLCELAKPWLMLRTSFRVACDDFDLLENVDFAEFNNWFSSYQQPWCDHWRLTDWNPVEMLQVIPIGEIANVDLLINNIRNNRRPTRITQ
jgi:hypothetical protein